MKVFYHNDDDGKCAAFWVKEEAEYYDKYEIDFYEMNYGRAFPFELIKPNEQVFIVDYSIEPNEMDRLLSITDDVTWIDHHISAIEKYKDYGKDIKGIRKDGVAACMLTYCYFTQMIIYTTKYQNNGSRSVVCIPFTESMMEPAPLFTKFIADYDVWNFKYGDLTRGFHESLKLFDLNPKAEIKFTELYGCNNETSDSEYSYMISSGLVLLKSKEKEAEWSCKQCGFSRKWEGYNCFLVNTPSVSGDFFKSVDNGKYDLFIGFYFTGGVWRYSLRSKTVNCATLASKYGGGGHKGAAGFENKEFLFAK